MSVVDARVHFLGHWIVDHLVVHPERAATDAELVQAARDQTNNWLASSPADRTAWLAAEGWASRTLAPSAPLIGRLAMHFGAADESRRHGILVRGDRGDNVPTTVLALVREAGPRESYLIYDPSGGGEFVHFASLEALCKSPLVARLDHGVTLYWPMGAKTTEAAPAPAPVHVPPAAPVRAKKPSATAAGGKKRGTTATVVPTSPAKKSAPEGVVALVEESSGETAK